jgi:hypothetical protein
MSMNPSLDDEEKQRKQKEFFERARKGVLKHLESQGGKLTLSQLHDHSLNTYLIQHQGFSRMMETFVDEGLVFFDEATQETLITDKGKLFIR